MTSPWAYGNQLTADRVRFTARLLDVDVLELNTRDELACIAFTFEVTHPPTMAGQVVMQEWCKCPPVTGDECLTETAFFEKIGRMAVALGSDTLNKMVGKEFCGTLYKGDIEL